MANPQADLILRHIRELATNPSERLVSDGELLRRFTGQGDEGAFTTLVQRHGLMVLRVSQRILHHTHDAEDVFQATFMVLARKASAVSWHDSVANWLYEVTYRLSREAKAAAARRQRHESRAARACAGQPAEITLSEALTALDEELNRLPPKYRMPLVLSCLQGATQEEAARQLGCSLATFKRRLERGREMLHGRLARRGLTLSAGLAAAELSRGMVSAVPPALITSTVRAGLALAAGHALGTGATSVKAPILADAFIHGMAMTKVKVVVALMLATCLLAGGAAISVRLAVAKKQPTEPGAGPADKDGPLR